MNRCRFCFSTIFYILVATKPRQKVHPFLMKLRPCLVFSFIMLSLTASAQETDSSYNTHTTIIENTINVVTGFTIGRYSKFVELGVAKSQSKFMRRVSAFTNIFASVEMKIDDWVSGKSEEKFIMGPKVGAWLAGGCGGMAMGANMIYYTNFTNGTLVFRPEIGLGYMNFKFVYGYNISLTKGLDMVDRSVFSALLGFKVKKLNRKTIY
jgi:hypothetical protein